MSSRERILDVATVLFVKQGYERTTIDEIGVAAGVTGPAIYRHFKGKSHLLEAVIAKVQEPTVEATAQLLDPTIDPLAALAGMVAIWVDASIRTKALTLTYVHEHPYLNAATRQRIRQRYRAVTDMWMQVLHRIRPDLSAAERMAMVDSTFWLIRSQAFYQSTVARDQLAFRLRCMILGALLADDALGDQGG